MAKKRGKGEGTIYRRTNGTWRAQVTLDGHRLSFTADSWRECREWIRNTLGQIDDGLTYASTKISIQEYLTGWLSSKQSELRQSSWTHYNQVSRQYVLPLIGEIRLRELRPDQIQGLYNRLLAQGIGIPTIQKIHTVLHSAFSHAVKTGLLTRNPASPAMPPKSPPREMKIYDENQVSQMLLAARGHRWEALYHLAVTTGMRQMELLGLKWTDLDWIKQTIRIERQLVRPDGEGVKFTSPKTKAGRRVVALGSQVLGNLRGRYDRQHLERQSAEDSWEEYGLVFTTKSGRPIHPRNLLRSFKQLLRDAGLPETRFHDLRHTSASLMLNHGVPLIVVARRLGHARPSITLDVYGHLIPTMQSKAAEMMDELVTPIQLHPVAPDRTRKEPSSQA